MAKDYMRHHETKRAADKLLQERYGDEHSGRYGAPLPPEEAIASVLAALGGYAAQGQEPPEVPAEDVLAALSQTDEARQRLDSRELRLITAARARGASWQAVADALGLATRQAAEGRALRLERGAQTDRGRDVASQRLDKARGRAAEAWCVENADRVREVAEQIYDTAGAWGLGSLEHAGVRGTLHGIGEFLATDADPVRLVGLLSSARYHLVPYSGKAPEPTGKQAAAAKKAAAALVELLAGQSDARYRVTSVRGEASP
ncbi:hypothetical protein [Streptomyces antarcticus]|uniref:hypothetical protein n=1 Tax=Streptomyces antarcticus TaxID=2996458 RepID=UPI00226F4A3E|nr:MULTISPECIES: hypothetical protein [unclassified Streptomyces]MCY0947288.1 hypothetical protein [Streptomyces sp. H34-AA3]MCZ4086533.1 hypothetical protein [Streptomyces sp. H34-S5]